MLKSDMTSVDAAGQVGTVDPDLLEMMESLFTKFRQDSASPGDEVALDHELWSALTELGLSRLTGAEENGGSGASWHEGASLLSAAAAAAVPVPLAENDLLAGWLLDSAGLRSDHAVRTAGRLDNGKAVVPWARCAESVVLLREAGHGCEIAEIPIGGVSVTPGANLAGEPRDVVSVPEGTLRWHPAPEGAGDEFVLRGALARAAQICGALETVVDLCVLHATQRTQFGRALAKFQAVQHLVADIAAETALARAATDAAVSQVSELGWSDESTALSVAVAKSCAGHAVSTVVRNAHQVHGAIGTTFEHELHRYTNPALSWRAEFGSAHTWDTVLARATIRTDRKDVWSLIADGHQIRDIVSDLG